MHFDTLFSGTCYEAPAAMRGQFGILMQSVAYKQDQMSDGQKHNILLVGYGKWMSRGRTRVIPMPYPPRGILRFHPSVMWSCYNLRQENLSLI